MNHNDNIIINTLGELKQIMSELQKIFNSLSSDNEHYYTIETIIIFIKFIYCKLRTLVLNTTGQPKAL